MIHYLPAWTIPAFVQENLQLTIFFGVLTYALFLLNWVITTDWESKFNWFSLIIGSSGILYLHYSDAHLVEKYEILFVSIWATLAFYHASTWNSNYRFIAEELNKRSVIASLQKYQGSILRFFITTPTTKNASNQWNTPPFRNAIHAFLVLVYFFLLFLHLIPFATPMSCNNDPSPLCCRYNYVMQGFDTDEVNMNYCSGRVRIAFAGSWSTGKTSIISALLGHKYSTAQIAPAPTTDKFVCLAMGAPYSDPVRSDDFERRRHCEMMGHINGVTHKLCGKQLRNVLDVADTNQEFENFVFFDMPGWQREYGDDCTYNTFYSQLIDMVDFVYVVWDVNHGKIEDEFAEFFKNKARGTHYELIYNRYKTDGVDMAFLNQQYAKISNGQEILSEMYTMKLHENSTEYALEFQNDIEHLRSKIKSVNQTVHDNRKKKMKENLMMNREKLTGLFSLRKLKIGDRLISKGLNVHIQPKTSWLSNLGLEL